MKKRKPFFKRHFLRLWGGLPQASGEGQQKETCPRTPLLTFFEGLRAYNGRQVSGDTRGEDAVTVVYLDAFLALNFVVNYLLLACAGKLDGGFLCRKRIALAAALGAGYGALALVPAWGFLEHPACKAGAAVGMLLVAYGRSDRLLRTGALFLVLACAFGGGLLLLAMVRGTGPGQGGLLGPSLGMRGILIAAALSYGGLSLLLRGQFTHTRSGGELGELTLTRQDRSVTVLALRDTGNTLQDPLTGRPVVVIEGEKLQGLYPELPLGDRESLSHPVDLLRELEGETQGLRLQLLPYRAVGVECGLLLALRLDRASYGPWEYRNCLTALSPTPLSDGGGYCALIGGGAGRG